MGDYLLDQKGHDDALALGRATGACRTCTDGYNSGQVKGFKATFRGTVKSLTGEPPLLLSVTEVLPFDTNCTTDLGVEETPALATCNIGQGDVGTLGLMHGSFMITSWGFILPTGVIIANRMRHRDPTWFFWHRRFQYVGVTLALAGFIIALYEFNVFQAGSFPKSLAHGSLGIVTMSLGLMQPINAYFRPHKEKDGSRSTARQYWEYLHKGSGYLACCTACATIILGTTLIGNPSLYFQIAYGSAVGVMIVLFLMLTRDKWMFKAVDEQNV